MQATSIITMIAGKSAEWIVVTDPAVHYRPARIMGRRYHITASTPKTGDGGALRRL